MVKTIDTNVAPSFYDYESKGKSKEEYEKAISEFEGKHPQVQPNTVQYGKGNVTVTVGLSTAGSDWYKENYTKSNAFKKLVSAYRADPNTKFIDPTDESREITATSMLEDYNTSLAEYATAYEGIRQARAGLYENFAVDLSDEQIIKASSSVNKDDYTATDAIFIPRWAAEKYNFGRLSSWNEDNMTVSAQDFFKEFYKNTVDNQDGANLLLDLEERMNGAAINATNSRDAEESTKGDYDKFLNDDDYKEEFARTYSLYKTASGSNAETDIIVDITAMTGGLANGVRKAAEEWATGMETLTMLPDIILSGIMNFVPGGAEFRKAFPAVTPQTLILVTAGTLIDDIKQATKSGQFGQFMSDLFTDLTDWSDLEANLADPYGKGAISEIIDIAKNDLNIVDINQLEDYGKALNRDAFSTGETVGYIAYKIVENTRLLNEIGKKVGEATTKFTTAGAISSERTLAEANEYLAGVLGDSGIATALAPFMSSTSTAKLITAVAQIPGFLANVSAQAFVETIVDNSSEANDFFRSGDAKAVDIFINNFIANGIGELTGLGSGLAFGKFSQTMPGRLISGEMTKATNRVASWKYSASYKILNFLNSGFDKAFGTGKWQKTLFVEQQARITGDIAKLKILGKNSQEFMDAIAAGKATVAAGQEAVAVSGDVVSKAISDIDEARQAAVKAAEEAAEATTKSAAEEAVDSFWSNVEKNLNAQSDLQYIRANLENAFDNIIAGTRVRMDEINDEIGESYVKFSSERASYLKMERESTQQLTYSAPKAKMTISDEAADYISYKTQYDGYIKMEGKDARLTEWVEGDLKSKVDELAEKLGPQLTAQLNNALIPAMGRYQLDLDGYLIGHRLMSAEVMAQKQAFIKSGRWGEKGELYIPTQRIFDGDIDKTLGTLENQAMDGEAYTTKTIGDDPYELKFGDTETHFLDPSIVIAKRLKQAATLSLAKEWGDAMTAIPSVSKRLISTAAEKARSATYKTAVKQMNSAIKNASLNKSISEVFQNAISDNNVYSQATMRTAKAKGSGSKVDELRKARNKYERDLYETYGIGRKQDGALKYKREHVTTKLGSEQIEQLNAKLPKNMQIPSYSASDFTEETFSDWWNNLSTRSQTYIKRKLGKRVSSKQLTYANVVGLFNTDVDGTFVLGLQRSYIDSNQKILNSRPYQNLAMDVREGEMAILDKQAAQSFRREYNVRNKAYNETKRLSIDELTDDGGINYHRAIGDATEDIINGFGDLSLAQTVVSGRYKSVSAAKSAVDMLVSEGVSDSTAKRYVTLRMLRDMKATEISNAIGMAGLPEDAASVSLRGYYKQMGVDIKDALELEYCKVVKDLTEQGFGDIVDVDDVFKVINENMEAIEKDYGQIASETRKWDKDKGKVVHQKNVIQALDENGNVALYETDPITAELYLSRPKYKEPGAIAKFFHNTNRVFRLAVVGYNFKSYMNQWSRDSLNAAVMGGARPFTDFGVSMEASGKIFGRKFAGHMSDALVEATGKKTIAYLEDIYGNEWTSAFLKNAAENGIPAERAAVEFVAGNKGYKMLPNREMLTEVGYYSGGKGGKMKTTPSLMSQLDEVSGGADTALNPGYWKEAQGKMKKAWEFLEDHQLGQFRETTLRENVYASTYRRYIESGYTVSQAKTMATRFALDATTDFARQVGWGTDIVYSVPFLGATINSTSSMLRLMEIDPAGVMGRFIGNIIIPYMSLLAESLSSEENYEIYKNFHEYDKEDNMLLVMNGQAYSIPIPQELSTFVAPFRQAMEKSRGVNDHSWIDLIASDLLSLSPYDLSGFVDLDYNSLMSDKPFMERIGRGFEKLIFGQLSPEVVKSAYIATTGRDPYKGKSVLNAYYTIDADGNQILMDSSKSEFVNMIAELFGGDMNANLAYEVLKPLLGGPLIDMLDSVTALATGISEGDPMAGAMSALTNTLESTLGAGASAFKADVYSKSKSEWRQAVAYLTDEKNELMKSDGQLAKLVQAINTTDDVEKKAKLRAQYREIANEYYNKVFTIVNNLNANYPGTYNKSKFATTIALMNLEAQTSLPGSTYETGLDSGLYFANRQRAIQTMKDMGFSSVQDSSIFGYGYTDQSGNYKFKWNAPLDILGMDSIIYGQTDLITSNIEAILKDADINRYNMFNGYNSLNKAQKKEYKKQWNAKVVRTLSPYIQSVGVERALSDYAVRDVLDNYIFVSNPFKAKDYMYEIFGVKNAK